MVLLSGSYLARLAGTDCLTRQIDHRVEQIEAPNDIAVPMAGLDIGSAADLLEDVVEVAEATDDDATKHCFLLFNVVLRLDVPAFGSQAGLYESSGDRALTPFRLRAFSGRGSPSA